MTDVARWLDGRTPAMPDELRRALDAALERAALEESAPNPAGLEHAAFEHAASEHAGLDRTVPGASSVADLLAAAGMAALRRAIDDDVATGPDRQSATDLLAADALLTYACEAAAEEGPEALDRLTGSLGFGRFQALLEPGAT